MQTRRSPVQHVKREFWKFIQFGLAGVPGFILGIGLNVLLVDRLHWPKPVAYLPVMFLQTASGFLINHYFVFEGAERRPFMRAFLQFWGSMALVRAFDWATYTALVELARMPIVLAQITCTCIFLVVKFGFARIIFRSKTG